MPFDAASIQSALRKAHSIGHRQAIDGVLASLGRTIAQQLAPDLLVAPAPHRVLKSYDPAPTSAHEREHGPSSDPDLHADPHQALLLAQLDHLIRCRETGEDPEPGDKALHRLWEEPEELANVLAPHVHDKPQFDKAIAYAIFLKAAERAPKGGISLTNKQGKLSFYPGGRWIPSSVIADASPAEKSELAERKASTRPNPLSPREKAKAASATKIATRDSVRKHIANIASDIMLRPHEATPDKYRDLAEAIREADKNGHLAIDGGRDGLYGLRALRLKLSASFGGGRRRDQMVKALIDHAENAAKELQDQKFNEAFQAERERASRRAPVKKSRAKESESVLSYVRAYGGIDPKSLELLASYENMQRAVQDGIPMAAFRKGGRGLDQIAQELEANGHIHVPEDENAGSYVLDLLRERALSLHADLTKQTEKALHEYHEAQRAAVEHGEREEATARARRGAQTGRAEGEADPLGEHGEGSGTHTATSGDEPRTDLGVNDDEFFKWFVADTNDTPAEWKAKQGTTAAVPGTSSPNENPPALGKETTASSPAAPALTPAEKEVVSNLPPASAPPAAPVAKHQSPSDALMGGKSFADWQHETLQHAYDDNGKPANADAESALKNVNAAQYIRNQEIAGKSVVSDSGRKVGTVVGFTPNLTHAIVRHDDGSESTQNADGLNLLSGHVKHELDKGKHGGVKPEVLAHFAKKIAQDAHSSGRNISEVLREKGIDPAKAMSIRGAISAELDKLQAASKPEASPELARARERAKANQETEPTLAPAPRSQADIAAEITAKRHARHGGAWSRGAPDKKPTEAEVAGASEPSVVSAPNSVSTLSDADFANAVQSVASKQKPAVGTRVFIHHVYDELKKRDPSLTESDFKKRLIEANMNRRLNLTTADLIQAFDKNDIARAATPSRNSTYHLIDANPPETTAPKPPRPEPGRKSFAPTKQSESGDQPPVPLAPSPAEQKVVDQLSSPNGTAPAGAASATPSTGPKSKLDAKTQAGALGEEKPSEQTSVDNAPDDNAVFDFLKANPHASARALRDKFGPGVDAAAKRFWEANKPKNKPNSVLPDASRPTLTDAESAAVRAYTERGHEGVNAALRGEKPHTPETQRLHAELQAAMAKAKPFPEPVPVISGRKVPAKKLAGYIDSLKSAAESGNSIPVGSYLSTSTGDKIDSDFEDSSVVLHIQATRGLDVGPHTKFTGKNDERELVLPADAQLKIKGVKKKGDQWIVNAEQVAASSHASESRDYGDRSARAITDTPLMNRNERSAAHAANATAPRAGQKPPLDVAELLANEKPKTPLDETTQVSKIPEKSGTSPGTHEGKKVNGKPRGKNATVGIGYGGGVVNVPITPGREKIISDVKDNKFNHAKLAEIFGSADKAKSFTNRMMGGANLANAVIAVMGWDA